MEWWQKNLALKLIALALAVVTWFYMNSVTSDWRTIERVPVQARVAPGVKARLEPTVVDVVIRGTREDVRQVSRPDLYVVVDVSRDNGRTPVTVKLTPDSVRHPSRVQIAEVRPAEIVVHLTATGVP